MEVELVKASALRPAPWRTTYVLRPDLRLLKQSIEDFGWLSPIVVRAEDSTIIDGFHRWMLHPDGDIPVVWVACDEIDAMVMHIRLNRARGAIINKSLSKTLRKILFSHKYAEEEVRLLLGMSVEEFTVLAEGTLVKIKKVKEHHYSQAWVPVETSGREKARPVSIERPPNADQ